MKKTPIIPEIVQQFVDDAVFWAQQRKRGFINGVLNFAEVTEIEKRLHAHLNGLVVSGDGCWPFLENNLSFEDYGEFFAASYFVINLEDEERFFEIVELALSDESLLGAVVDALVWSEYPAIEPLLQLLISNENPLINAIAIKAKSGHGRISSSELEGALNSDDLFLLDSAILAVAHNGIEELHPSVTELLDHDDEKIKFSASWSATRFGSANAMESLKQFAGHLTYGELALQFVVKQQDKNNTTELLRTLFSNDDTKRLSILGLGYYGNPATIPNLIQLMEDVALARIAGEAFSMISGLDLNQAEMVASPPSSFDDESDSGQDDEFPWPDIKKLSAWWEKTEVKAHFSRAERYFVGQPESRTQYLTVLTKGTHHQRLFSANSLSLYNRSESIFNVTAPTKRQLQSLKTMN